MKSKRGILQQEANKEKKQKKNTKQDKKRRNHGGQQPQGHKGQTQRGVNTANSNKIWPKKCGMSQSGQHILVKII